MKQDKFKSLLWITVLLVLFIGILAASPRTLALAQEPTPSSGEVFVTVTYPEQINIRNGPSTVLYEIIGNMQPGEVAQALGVSPGRDWVQIVFPPGPEGIGWVHTSLIAISSGNLQIIEPPPTPTPRTTPTVDPTLAAAYVFEPTATRMPTFTPPPTLEVLQFSETPATKPGKGVPMGAYVLGSGILGVLGYLISFVRRR